MPRSDGIVLLPTSLREGLTSPDVSPQFMTIYTRCCMDQPLQPDPNLLQNMHREGAAYPHLSLITNKNGRKDVGQTVDVRARFNRHTATPNKRMAADVACAKAAGTQDFSVGCLETTQDQGAAACLEAHCTL